MKVRLWVGKILWKKKWQPTPVFFSGKSHGQRSLVGYSPWGCKRVRHNLVLKQQQFWGVGIIMPTTLSKWRFKNIYFYVYIWQLGLSCSMWHLIPWPELKPAKPALQSGLLPSHWTTRKSQKTFLKKRFWPGMDSWFFFWFDYKLYGSIQMVYNYFENKSLNVQMSPIQPFFRQIVSICFISV